jgi:cytochrome c peroxidase
MKLFTYLTFSLLAVVLLGACKKDKPEIPDPPTFQNPAYLLLHDGLPAPQLPADNPLTVEGVKLGRFLFYDTKLSANNNISCASCHVQTNGFSDINTLSIGTDGLLGLRQAMSTFNMAWNDNGFFWDGRADFLRHQALMPIQDELEMNETLDNVIAKL